MSVALLSSAINLLMQWVVMNSVSIDEAYVLALLTGTGAGWISKYVLDKRYVFRHHSSSNVELAGNMVTHASAGVFTTLIFWAIESLFHFYVPIPGAMYVGAAFALFVCNVLRYQIDRLVVFRPAKQLS